jgi:phosphatidylglycerophosphatase A
VLPTLAVDDPGWIVIDEWVGQWLALALIIMVYGVSVLNMALAFAAFRLFDVLKPFPIRQIEHLGPAWWSIMADDVMAGLMGGGLVLAILALWGYA